MLIYLFSVRWGILPAGGMHTIGVEALSDRAKYLVLPVLTLSLANIAGYTRFVRASMMETLRQDYIRTARAKGVPEHRVVFKHALRNALVPVVTIVALSFGNLFSGALITETLFSYLGMDKIPMLAPLADHEYASLYRIVLIISLVGWTTVARLVRGAALSLREREYVLSARSQGAGALRIMATHILPNTVSPIIVATTLSIGNIILLESILSFLGLGIQPPVPRCPAGATCSRMPKSSSMRRQHWPSTRVC